MMESVIKFIDELSKMRRIIYNDIYYFAVTKEVKLIANSLDVLIEMFKSQGATVIDSLCIINLYTVEIITPSELEIKALFNEGMVLDKTFIYVARDTVVYLEDLNLYRLDYEFNPLIGCRSAQSEVLVHMCRVRLNYNAAAIKRIEFNKGEDLIMDENYNSSNKKVSVMFDKPEGIPTVTPGNIQAEQYSQQNMQNNQSYYNNNQSQQPQIHYSPQQQSMYYNNQQPQQSMYYNNQQPQQSMYYNNQQPQQSMYYNNQQPQQANYYSGGQQSVYFNQQSGGGQNYQQPIYNANTQQSVYQQSIYSQANIDDSGDIYAMRKKKALEVLSSADDFLEDDKDKKKPKGFAKLFSKK